MREIKFRVWDKKNKKFIFPEINRGHIKLTLNGLIRFILSDDYDLIQYIGLKDKNGKEIYDSDILKTPNAPNVTVYWYEQGGRWNGKYHGLSKDCEINDSVFYTSEIIGNIYENPELLK